MRDEPGDTERRELHANAEHWHDKQLHLRISMSAKHGSEGYEHLSFLTLRIGTMSKTVTGAGS